MHSHRRTHTGEKVAVETIDMNSHQSEKQNDDDDSFMALQTNSPQIVKHEYYAQTLIKQEKYTQQCERMNDHTIIKREKDTHYCKRMSDHTVIKQETDTQYGKIKCDDTIIKQETDIQYCEKVSDQTMIKQERDILCCSNMSGYECHSSTITPIIKDEICSEKWVVVKSEVVPEDNVLKEYTTFAQHSNL